MRLAVVRRAHPRPDEPCHGEHGNHAQRPPSENVNSKALNPLLVQVLALGYFYHMYRNRSLLKDGGVMILTHPCSDKFDPDHHPSYIEFFNRLLPETRDSYTLEKKYQDEFAYNPTYVEMYRHGNAYHGAHPFFMWYWGQCGREKCGRVIVVGSDNATVPECGKNVQSEPRFHIAQ